MTNLHNMLTTKSLHLTTAQVSCTLTDQYTVNTTKIKLLSAVIISKVSHP